MVLVVYNSISQLITLPIAILICLVLIAGIPDVRHSVTHLQHEQLLSHSGRTPSFLLFEVPSSLVDNVTCHFVAAWIHDLLSSSFSVIVCSFFVAFVSVGTRVFQDLPIRLLRHFLLRFSEQFTDYPAHWIDNERMHGSNSVIKIQPDHPNLFPEIFFKVFNRCNRSVRVTTSSKFPLENGRIGIVVVVDPACSNVSRPVTIVAFVVLICLAF
mmetsp:Transcript_11222/g.32374  ORF Transcript_11222/g.32374 Transcript_11222/m.32374 type:complete len:213 (-) Transcript_11222:457-1095(-)